jgi:hypothetical protein
MTTDQARRLAMIEHIVHDYLNLVAFGTMTSEALESPLNHATQHSFLVECRKRAAFLKNNRGPKHSDAVACDYTRRTTKTPKLSEWKNWGRHMDQQLMHDSYHRVDNKTSWDGSANAALLAEFKAAWAEFLSEVAEPYATEFQNQLRTRSQQREYKRFAVI